MKKKVILLLGIAAAVYFYQKQTDGKKRFLKEIFRQIPFLIPRYFV